MKSTLKFWFKKIGISVLVAIVVTGIVFAFSENAESSIFLGILGAYIYFGKEVSFNAEDNGVKALFVINKIMIVSLFLFIIISFKDQVVLAVIGIVALVFLFLLELAKLATEALSKISEYDDYEY